ncbi:MAG: M64 family metallopeptidase [Phycisphaerae bacterium]|jgi:hypothetical protein|nr:M64 family metallopeptidase [Phycisphaerae bacterium]
MKHVTRSTLSVISAACLLLAATYAQGVVTVINNGPSANRVDVVFLGDGYTAADHAAGTYTTHINSYLNYMFANTTNSDPFYRYRNYFNVHRIDVTSNESGADKPLDSIYVDTALDASYSWGGGVERLLYVNGSKANAARNASLAGASFSAEMQFVTVNDAKYGGGGGSYAVYAGGNGSAYEVAMHEMGHSFDNLADEYGGSAGPYAGGEPSEVNVTKNSTGAKWSQWLGYNQPGIGVIGAYEGARYYNTGLYRPSNNSKMRSLNQPFDAISREKIILDIYALVDPLDAWRDNSLPLTDPGDLFVERIDDSVIDVEWFVNGAPVAGAAGETFDLLDFGYGAGLYDVEARAYDPTAFDPVDGWVRMNASELEQTIAWDVTLTPEPATMALLMFGGLAVLRRRKS